MVQADTQRSRRADGLLAGMAFALTAAGVALGGGPSAVALTATAVAALVSLLLGHVPGRGAAVAGLALVLGSALMSRATGAVPWGDLALLGLTVASATLGASMADRMAPRPAGPSAEGRRLTVVVALEGPADVPGAATRRPAAPPPDSERRRRERLDRREPVGIDS